MPKFIDLIGTRFGKLLVLSRSDTVKKHTTWNCLCDCGNSKVIRGSNLRTGKSSSCGCVMALKAKERLHKHGKSNRKNKNRYYEYTREIHIKRKYGLSLEQYNQMFEDQNGKCVICDYKFGQKKGDCYVDHCHETSVVRGLLCQNCNTGLGNFKDKPERINKAAEYLLKFKYALAR
jgi:hypothetical protein